MVFLEKPMVFLGFSEGQGSIFEFEGSTVEAKPCNFRIEVSNFDSKVWNFDLRRFFGQLSPVRPEAQKSSEINDSRFESFDRKLDLTTFP